MSDIESAPLAPLDARTKITEADRAKVYELIGKHLDYLINGLGSYHPDGGRKSLQTTAEDVGRLKGQVMALKGFVDDPASILDSAAAHLEDFRKSFGDAIGYLQPKDEIALPPDLTPWSSDENAIDADRFQGARRPDSRPIALRHVSRNDRSAIRYVSRIADPVR